MGEDFISSGKGLGVVGATLGVIVLGGFGGLGLLVFNSDEQVRDDPKDLIEANEKTMAYFKDKLKELDVEIAENKKLFDAQSGLQRLEKTKERVLQEKAELEAGVVSGGEAIEGLEKEWEDYKGQYRTNERARAVGETYPELKTLDGKTYTDLKITGVTPLALRMSSREKVGGIPFQVLPLEWQDRFQFDDGEAEKLKEKEIREREARGGEMKLFTAKTNLKKLKEALEQAQKDLREAQAGSRNYKNLARQLEGKAAGHLRAAESAMAAHERARALGNMSSHAGRAKKERGKAAQAKNDAAKAEREANRLDATMPGLKAKIDMLGKQIPLLEKTLPGLEEEIRKKLEEKEKEAEAEQGGENE